MEGSSREYNPSLRQDECYRMWVLDMHCLYANFEPVAGRCERLLCLTESMRSYQIAVLCEAYYLVALRQYMSFHAWRIGLAYRWKRTHWFECGADERYWEADKDRRRASWEVFILVDRSWSYLQRHCLMGRMNCKLTLANRKAICDVVRLDSAVNVTCSCLSMSAVSCTSTVASKAQHPGFLAGPATSCSSARCLPSEKSLFKAHQPSRPQQTSSRNLLPQFHSYVSSPRCLGLSLQAPRAASSNRRSAPSHAH